MKRSTAWTICCAVFVALSALTFTPLVIPAGVAGPFLLGMPRALWAGILVTIAFVALTFAGARVHPGGSDDA